MAFEPALNPSSAETPVAQVTLTVPVPVGIAACPAATVKPKEIGVAEIAEHPATTVMLTARLVVFCDNPMAELASGVRENAAKAARVMSFLNFECAFT